MVTFTIYLFSSCQNLIPSFVWCYPPLCGRAGGHTRTEKTAASISSSQSSSVFTSCGYPRPNKKCSQLFKFIYLPYLFELITFSVWQAQLYNIHKTNHDPLMQHIDYFAQESRNMGANLFCLFIKASSIL